MSAATLEDFRLYLNELFKGNDPRLQDTLVIYLPEQGEYLPVEFLEFEGDEILDDGHIFLTPV